MGSADGTSPWTLGSCEFCMGEFKNFVRYAEFDHFWHPNFIKFPQRIKTSERFLSEVVSAIRPLVPRQGSTWLLDGRLQALCQGAGRFKGLRLPGDLMLQRFHRDECRFLLIQTM